MDDDFVLLVGEVVMLDILSGSLEYVNANFDDAVGDDDAYFVWSDARTRILFKFHFHESDIVNEIDYFAGVEQLMHLSRWSWKGCQMFDWI